MKNKIIRVGMGGYGIANKDAQLTTMGLGSCVGVLFYCERLQIALLAHIVLPINEAKLETNERCKYADSAVPFIIDKLMENGIRKDELVIKMVGGASMFKFADNKNNLDIGMRNVATLESTLRKYDLRTVASDIGGNKGRTILVNASDGMILVSKMGEEPYWI